MKNRKRDWRRKPKIAVIVPIHNGLLETRCFIQSYTDSLQKSGMQDRVRLFIADDGSIDGSCDWIRANHADAYVLKGDGTLWWSASINIVLEHISAQEFSHFLLFNNDNLVDSNFFSVLEKILDKDGYRRIISSKVINLHPWPYVINAGITFDRKKARYLWNSDLDKECICNTAAGMGTLIPMEVIERIGCFDAKGFPQKSGDTDFFLRAEQSSFLVHYYPELIVHNNNKQTGFCDNNSLRGIFNAYSFPKGYMNLKVDFRLFWRHGNKFGAIYRILSINCRFIGRGMAKIIRNKLFKSKKQ